MTLELFITILVMSATATSIAVQIVKTILDKMGKTATSVSQGSPSSSGWVSDW